MKKLTITCRYCASRAFVCPRKTLKILSHVTTQYNSPLHVACTHYNPRTTNVLMEHFHMPLKGLHVSECTTNTLNTLLYAFRNFHALAQASRILSHICTHFLKSSTCWNVLPGDRTRVHTKPASFTHLHALDTFFNHLHARDDHTPWSSLG